MTYLRDCGRIFYFQPGHETCPSFHNPLVLQIIYNAVKWAAPSVPGYEYKNHCPHVVKDYSDREEKGKLKSNMYPVAFDALGIER